MVSAYDAVMRRKAREVKCTIYINEIDGKLSIMANIPDGTENTIAAALTTALIEQSAGIMNTILGDDQKVEKMPRPS